MKQGQATLESLTQSVIDRSARKDDLVVPASRLIMLNGSELSVPTNGGDSIGEGRVEYDVAQIAHRQIGTHLGIPAKFYDRLRTATIGEDGNPDLDLRRLLDSNVNTLLQRTSEKRLIRTYRETRRPSEDGAGFVVPAEARAFLSNRYRRRDDDELLAKIGPVLMSLPGAKLASCELTETRFYLKVVTERLEGEVAEGDYVQAGVMIRNSEVGHGSLSIKPFIYRLVCTNGMVVPVFDENSASYRHVGRRIEATEDGRYSDETLKLDDEAFYAKVAEDVRRAVDETAFNAILVQLREAKATQQIDDPAAAVERLAQRFSLTDGEGAQVLKQLALGGDLSAYGALNAVTRIAQDVESYDRATDLETVGGEILTLATTKPREWEAIAA
jgi:hypothetical protein